MKKHIDFHTSNDLNGSNSFDEELNDILTEDLLTYSEDKSQSLISPHLIIDKNKNKKTNKHQPQKILNIHKTEKNSQSNNSEITISFLSSKNRSESEKIKIKKKIKKEVKENGKVVNDINNGNASNKDLSALQVSLSNLLSDIDSKDIFFNQNNNNKSIVNNECNNNNINKNENNNSIKKELIDISNENNYYRNNLNNNLKEKNLSHEEHSSSVCNYSQSLYTNNSKINDNKNKIITNNNENIFLNNINNNIFNIGNNFIINSNLYEESKDRNSRNSLKFEKNKNIYNEYIIKEKIREKYKYNQNLTYNKKIQDNCQINSNEKMKNLTPSKLNFQIEKGENIQLSINTNNNVSQNNTIDENVIQNYNYKKISFLSISKTQNFTIDSSSMDNNYNISDYYDLFKKNNNTTSMEMIREILEKNKITSHMNKQNYNKNKIKLINNKNIVILNDESKKFFYNPKTKYKSNEIFLTKKNKNSNRTEYNFNLNGDMKLKTLQKDRNVKREKKLISNNINNYNIHCHNFKKIRKIQNVKIENNHEFKNKSFNKNIFEKQCLNKKNYFKNIKNAISSFNSYNNSKNKKKKHYIKVLDNLKNIDKNDNNSNLNKNNSKSKNKKESKSKLKNKNECITEPIKKLNKIKYVKNTNSATSNLLNKIKIAQKITKNRLLNKLTNINVNINNNRTLFPILPSKFKISKGNPIKEIKKVKNIQDYCNSRTANNWQKININKLTRLSKNKCLTGNIYLSKEKKIKKNTIYEDNQHKKLNSQINLAKLLKNFNNKEKNWKKNNKSLFNFGNIFFINQSHTSKKLDNDFITSNMNNKSNLGMNKEKIIILNNDNFENFKLNTLNYSIIKHRPQIISDFSNYKKKENLKCNLTDKQNVLNIKKNLDFNFKSKRADTDINNNIRNNLNIKIKIKDTFKVRNIEGDTGNDTFRGNLIN